MFGDGPQPPRTALDVEILGAPGGLDGLPLLDQLAVAPLEAPQVARLVGALGLVHVQRAVVRGRALGPAVGHGQVVGPAFRGHVGGASLQGRDRIRGDAAGGGQAALRTAVLAHDQAVRGGAAVQ